MIDGKVEKYFSLSSYEYAADNPVRFIDPDGYKVVDPNGHIMYTQNGGWTKYATADAKRIGGAMMQTRTGAKQWNNMVNATHPITMKVSDESHVKTNVKDNQTIYTLGSTANQKITDPKTGKTIVTRSEIIVYEGTINEYMNDVKKSINNNSKGQSYLNNTINNDERIGAVGGHESWHATDPINIQQVTDNSDKKNPTNYDVEAIPVNVEMQILDETGASHIIPIEPIKPEQLPTSQPKTIIK